MANDIQIDDVVNVWLELPMGTTIEGGFQTSVAH